jgi:hypothetical protein
MLLVREISSDSIVELLGEYAVSMEQVADNGAIDGSFWGEPEAGVVGKNVFVRGDTPVHSLLHEVSHIVCMTPERRMVLKGNAGGDDLEECAVCYLQVVLADELPGVGAKQLMRDMDEWGYSFRLGSTRRWFEEDADDARDWLIERDLLRTDRRPTFRLRES